MRWRGWSILGLAIWPVLAHGQAVTQADLLGGWKVHAEHVDSVGDDLAGWLVLSPDHMWAYGGPFMQFAHGGGRWRLMGDTLWLGKYGPYYDLIMSSLWTLQAKGLGIGVVDKDVVARGRIGENGFNRPNGPYPSDAVYWSKAFRDTTAQCEHYAPHTQCSTFVYKVTKTDQRTLSLVRLDSLSLATTGSPPAMTLKRDSLTSCKPYKDGDGGQLVDDGIYRDGCVDGDP